jgi:hypothetical protein
MQQIILSPYYLAHKIDIFTSFKKGRVLMMTKTKIFFLMIACAASSLFATGGVLFANSGFESTLSPWKLSFYNTDTMVQNAKISLDTANALFGKQYCKITVTRVDTVDSVGHNWYIQLWEPTWQSKPNVNYTYSCWARTNDSISRLIHIAVTGDSASEYTYITGPSQSFTLTKDWQLCQVNYTWTNPGTSQKRHFRIFVGGEKGVYEFDSMALDTATPIAVKNPFAISYRTASPNYTFQLLPNSIRFDIRNVSPISSHVAIYSLEGRLISSHTIPAASSTFEIAKPRSGAWIVDVNSNKNVIRLP